ncbi:MAG: hypothetical protein AB1806_06405 [Acidobacteriota bacterium]
MPAAPREVTVALTPRARFDVIDVRAEAARQHGDALDEFQNCLYCSFHTTAGYLDQSLASRLGRQGNGVEAYVGAFRTVFPEGADYRHDNMEERSELTDAQRVVEPRNGDSHLGFMAAGLKPVVTYQNIPGGPVSFVDLDGMQADQRPRRRVTTVVGYAAEEVVARVRISIPVSNHPLDSVNLKDPRLGFYEQLAEMIGRFGVGKGRLRLDLASKERHVGLTVNEYETLLMQHDLTEVMRNPVRFVAERGRHALHDPRLVPTKTLGYAKYDLVRALNEALDALGLSESLVERILAKMMGVPAERFFRMKRSVSLLVSDRQRDGRGAIVEGTYQSPILVQWRSSETRMREIEATLTRFV